MALNTSALQTLSEPNRPKRTVTPQWLIILQAYTIIAISLHLMIPSFSSHQYVSHWQSMWLSKLSMTWHSCWVPVFHDAFDLLPHYGWISVVHSCPPSPIGPTLLLLPVLEQSASPYHVHNLYVFSRVASKLSSSNIPSHDFYRNICSASAMTVLSNNNVQRYWL